MPTLSTEPTTERLIVEHYQSSDEGYLLYFIHLATYEFACQFTEGKRVLDYGCGTGYGTGLISSHCATVTGIDMSPDAIAAAKAGSSALNLSYLLVDKAEVSRLPLAAGSFDVVLSFQVIEHVRDVKAYLGEIERVLAPGGCVLLATPDRSTRLFSFQKPWNIWHVTEYSELGLRRVMEANFDKVILKRIGGDPDVLKFELRRTSRLKWLSLPFTLPFVPESLRVACLRLLKHLNYIFSRHDAPRITPSFDGSALRISEIERPSTVLLAIARKASGT